MSNGYNYLYYQQTDRHQASQSAQALTQGSTSACFPSQQEPSSNRPQSLSALEAFERSQYASARSMKNTLPEHRRDWYNNSQNESASSDVGGSLGLSGNQERVTSRPPDGRTYDTSALGNLAHASGLDFNGTSTHLGQSRPAPSTSQYALSDANLQNSESLSQDQGGASSKRYWPSRMDATNSGVSSMVSNYNQPPSASLVSNARHSSPYTKERAHSRHQSSSSGGTYKRGGPSSASASSTYNQHHQYGAQTTLAHGNLEVGRSNVRTPTINTSNHRRPSAQKYSQPTNLDSPALQDPHASKSSMRFAFHTDPGASGLSQGARQVQQHSPEPLTSQRTSNNNIQPQQSSALDHLEPQNSSRPIQRIATPTYYSQHHHAQRTSSPSQSSTTQRDEQQPNPVTVDPSQVYNPYHEYERQVQAGQALAARRTVEQAAMIPERAQEINQTQTVTAPLPQDQPAEETSSMATKKNGKSRPLRQSKSMKKKGTSSINNEVQTATAEIKGLDASIVQHESDLATMEAEMKEMVEKMRKYSTQNPEMFLQVWGQVKRTGSQNTTPQPPLPKSLVSEQPPTQSPVQQTTPSVEPQRKRKRSNKTRDQRHQSNLQRPQYESGQLNPVNATSETRPDMLQITQADESQSQPLNVVSPGVGSQARAGPVKNVQGETKTVQVTSRPDVKMESLATAALVHLRSMDGNTEKIVDKEKFLGLLASNPTYVGLCEALERLGLLFDRGKLARALLTAVPDANSTARRISQEINLTLTQAPPHLHENQPIVTAATETNHSTQSANPVAASSNSPLPNSGQKRVVGTYNGGTPAALEAEASDASADKVRVSPTTQPPDQDAISASNEPQPKVPAVPQVQRLQNSPTAPAHTIPPSLQTPPLFTQQSRETIARFIPPRHFPPPPPYYFPANGVPPFNQSASKLGINSHHPHSQVPHAPIGSPFADGAKISLNHNGDMPTTANPSFTHTNSPLVPRPLPPPSQYQSLPVHQQLLSHKRRISEVVDLTDGQPGYYKVARHDSPHLELGARHANLHPSRSMTSIQLPFAGTPISAPDAWSKLHPLRNADLVSAIDRKRALRRSTYNPRFIARDILLASGRHPDVGALNQHLELLKKNFSCISNDSELTTFRWDFVDPGGVPVRSRASSNTVTKLHSAGVNATQSAHPSPNHRISSQPVPADPSDGDIEEIPASEFRTTTNGAKELVDRDTEQGKLDRSRSSLGNPNNKVKANHPVRSVETEPDQESSDSPLRKRHSHRGTSSDKAVSKSTMIPARGKSNRGKSVSSMPLRPSGLRHSMSSSLNFEGKFAVVVESSPPSSTTSSNERHAKAVQMATQRRQPADIFMQAPNATFKEYRCGWKECGATLHNVNTLRKHVEKKHGKPTDGILTCFWKDCDTEEMIVEDEVSGCDRIVSGPKTFASQKAWEDHVEKVHVTPYLWELGDGPVSEPYDGHTSDLSGHLTDDQGRRLTPIAKPLPRKRKPGLAPGEDEGSVSSSLLSEKDIGNKRLRIALERFHEVQKRRRIDGLEGPDMGPFIERGGCRLAKNEFRQIFDLKKGYSKIVKIDSDPEV